MFQKKLQEERGGPVKVKTIVELYTAQRIFRTAAYSTSHKKKKERTSISTI